MRQYMMGNSAIALGAAESGVKVVSGYPGTPATEIVEELAKREGLWTEWCTNELVALQVALGASLCNMRSMAVMKHNGTNVATDFLMHLNFTGVRGGMVLVSADDPGGNSSQNEEDTRILVNTYGHLAVLDPCSPEEAREMTKAAFDLSERTESCIVMRPVMRICHARSVVEVGEQPKTPAGEAQFVDDRSRFVMSAVSEKSAGGKMRPLWRHEILNGKMREFVEMVEMSPFNQVEDGDGAIGVIGCGIGYTYAKEAENILGRKLPVLKIGTLPIPRKMTAEFLRKVSKVIVMEEIEPVVERMVKEMCFEENLNVTVLGRSSFLPGVGELSAQVLLDALSRLDGTAQEKNPESASMVSAPIRTRTQCVGCNYRGLLHVLKNVTRRHKGIVTGDIGCHDAGSFPPIELQSTIYCMGASIAMATGIKAAGFRGPAIALIGDSTFFHSGLNGLVNAVYCRSNITVVVADNGTTAMTGFQPHPGSGQDIRGRTAPRIDIGGLADSLGIKTWRVNPYNLEETEEAIEAAVQSEGVSLVISSAPCYLLASKQGGLPFTPRLVTVDAERCNGCKRCITELGCPALHYKDGKAAIDSRTCVHCGICAGVCTRGALV